MNCLIHEIGRGRISDVESKWMKQISWIRVANRMEHASVKDTCPACFIAPVPMLHSPSEYHCENSFRQNGKKKIRELESCR